MDAAFLHRFQNALPLLERSDDVRAEGTGNARGRLHGRAASFGRRGRYGDRVGTIRDELVRSGMVKAGLAEVNRRCALPFPSPAPISITVLELPAA
jgi:hypothetical protein